MFDIFKEFDMLFNRFDRPVKDVAPYRIFKKEDEVVIVVNTLGLGKDDVSVEIVDDYLEVKGSVELEDVDFINSVDLKFSISRLMSDRIDKITYTNKNGLTYVHIKMKKEKKNVLKIEYKE